MSGDNVGAVDRTSHLILMSWNT